MDFFAIAAGKGGVGKSTVAVQLALAKKKGGERVALLDADLYGPSIPYLLPEDHPPKKVDDRWLPAYANGIATLSLDHFQKSAAVRAPMANQLISYLIRQVNWGEVDSFFIDFPPGTGDIHLTLCQQLPLSGVVLVTLPNELALLDVRKSAAVFQKMGVPIIGVIENMSFLSDAPETSPFGKGGGRRLAHELNAPFLGEIPIDSRLGEGGFYFPLFDEIASRLVGKEEKGTIVELKGEILIIDGEKIEVSALQQKCPCAACREECLIDRSVRVLSFQKVGLYAYRFTFSSGCSSGIYENELLKSCVHVSV
ncbi:MAG: Iron-sulfur cluster carrier protein [Chlamydiales bacterium]|nr:Iron-sulfur cluster carrier protein [Chlamydiales bacterium]MCH9620027.1 Iron-sulfur cluster carrier protein [Chlamydiales bacterium]MCH9622870.1 Iron-sulfur cluster carrier protein [Chlamydiales bacterium]